MSDLVKDDINLFEYLRVVWRHKALVGLTIGLTTVATSIFMYLKPNQYTASAVLLPIEKPSSMGLSSLVGSVGGGLGALASQAGILGSGASDKFVTILESRTISESVINRLNLREYFSQKSPNRLRNETLSMQDTLSRLDSQTDIGKDKKKGTVVVKFTDTDPDFAAKVTNTYTQALSEYIQHNSLSIAKKNRLFVENQLEKSKSELSFHEESLRKFQQKNRLVSLDTQAEIAVKTYAEVKAKISSANIELSLLNKGVFESDPRIALKKQEISELNKQLSSLEDSSSGPLVSFQKVPSLGLDYARLKRELLVREKVFEFLTQQYEMAKIQENQEDISFQVLDPAIPPERKSGPKRLITVLVSAAASLFLGVFLAFGKEFSESILEKKQLSNRQN